ncbi:MAG TPA: hypothetical protein VJ914_18560 [Pseudonocardiaceae bacterium]|nr:hypothetical protein [Pseudonocardiaceae bacterium]
MTTAKMTTEHPGRPLTAIVIGSGVDPGTQVRPGVRVRRTGAAREVTTSVAAVTQAGAHLDADDWRRP